MTQTRRRTRQRDAVTSLLREREDFRTAQQIHADLRAAGTDVGLTTVYRTLATLVDAGEADVLLAEDGEARYRACSRGHHHHLVCRECGFTVEVTADVVENWAQRVARENGFRDVHHTVEIVGTCDTCAAERG
ncbi:MAG: transcriptional repressor [Candidatus Nanopelagicales bacterium]